MSSHYHCSWTGKQRDLTLNLLRLSFHFKRCGLWTVLWLCPSQLWNTKMALIAAHLNTGVILVATVLWYVYNLRLPLPPYTPPPLPVTNKPYVSVDVKHHVYLLTIAPTPTAVPHICQKHRINTNPGTSFACLLTVSPSLCCLETEIFWEKGPSPYSSHILELQCPLWYSHHRVHSTIHADSQNVSVQKRLAI